MKTWSLAWCDALACSRRCVPGGLLLALIVVLVSMTGCGGCDDAGPVVRPPPPPPNQDIEELISIIEKFNEATRDPRKLNSYMASGAQIPPAKAAAYAKIVVSMGEEMPAPDGDNATIPVRVGERATIRQEQRDVNWTAVKEGGKWKLKDIPLK